MAPQRIPLNLYLLKEGTSPADAVHGSLDPTSTTASGTPSTSTDEEADGAAASWVRTWIVGDEPTEAPLPQVAEGPPSLLIRSSPAAHGWHTALQGFVADLPLGGDQSNLGALFFQPIGSNVVVWSFGNAWSLLDTSLTVDRFGLRAGLNALLTARAPKAPAGRPREVGVRGLTSAIRAAVVRKSTVVAARPSSPSAMERVDQSSDAAAMAELTTHHKTFDRVAAGRSLRFDARVASVADLSSYAAEAIRLYKRSDYAKDDAYKWIDYTVPVGNRAEVDAVLDELMAQATTPKPVVVVDLVWADADRTTGLTPSFVCFPNERSTPTSAKRTEMTWHSALEWLNARKPGAKGREALRTNLRFFVEGSSTPTAEQELWRLLVAQISLGTDTFMISDGEVWRASRSHIADIDNLLAARVTVNPTWLPRYLGGEREDSYNQRAATHGNHFLLDKSLVHLPGQTPFEPCDLLSGDGRFMHVKRKTSSGTMSHVVAQAIASTQLLRTEPSARDLLDKALLKQSPPLPALQEMRGHCASFASRPTGSVLVVVVGTWREAPDVTQLPLLTRISFNSWLRQMPCEAGIVLVGT